MCPCFIFCITDGLRTWFTASSAPSPGHASNPQSSGYPARRQSSFVVPFWPPRRAAGLCMQACQRPWVLRPLTLCFSQITSATTAPALITGAWPAPPSQATSVSLGLCSTPTVITCPARSSQSWEEVMPTAGTPGARWKARGALRRIKTYAWNCVPYPHVVCILSLFFFKNVDC